MSTETLTIDAALLGYIRELGVKEDSIAKDLREKTATLEMARMQISPEQGAFMGFIAGLVGAKRYVEIGVFTGYSMLSVARGIGSGFSAVACDVSKEWTDIAQEYWEKAEIHNAIELKLAPALETLSQLESETFDLAFIDADKANYDGYYEETLRLLTPKGLLMIDNIFWGGDVADESVTDEDTVAIRALNKKIMSDSRVEASMLPIGDGLMLVRKI